MFLTVSFKLHKPSTTKRNAIKGAMRLATAARAALYQKSEKSLQSLLQNPATPKPERKRAVSTTMAELVKDKSSFGLHGAAINKALRDGIQRDVQALLNSRLGLLAEHDAAAGASDLLPRDSGLLVGLALLESSTSKEQEDQARDLMNTLAQDDLRPLSFVRWGVYNGFKLIRNPQDQWFAWLPVGNKPVTRTQPMTDIRTGEPFKVPGTPGILVPLSFGEKHQARLLKQGIPRSAILRLDAQGDFYLNVSVELEPAQANVGEAVIGVDRGMEAIAAFAVKDGESILTTALVDGTALRQIQRRHERALQHAQRCGKKVKIKWKQHITPLVHETANKIADAALQYNARVVLEDLANIKNSQARRKPKFTVRTQSERNLNKQLIRQVYGQLEKALTYKLALRGLPAPKKVHAAGTSITCPACNNKDKANRPSRDLFKCLACGHQDHADINASINIASRGQRFFAGGKRHRQESGAIPAPRATSSRANDGSSIATDPGFGAKTVNPSAENSLNPAGSEIKGAKNMDMVQPLLADQGDHALCCGVGAGEVNPFAFSLPGDHALCCGVGAGGKIGEDSAGKGDHALCCGVDVGMN